MNIKKILVANRGEIALRVMKTCRELGIRTVAVHSEIDARAMHVRVADEACCIGPAPAKESYLVMEKVVEACLKTGADALHPGYGFLSENAAFVEMVTKAGILFIGPTADSIRRMGDKTAARQLASSVGIAIVPGSLQAITSPSEAEAIAAQIGYPLLLKASGGGGGKGMRIVRSVGELSSSLRSAQSEAQSAFGDERVYIERYIEDPRHIEVQVLGDNYGNVVHLGERECSIQRRHQKIVEESPSVAIDARQREELTAAATQFARAGGYRNAGTIEFILDREGRFYFLEMNTRLQVEHPVTEMRVGIDIVREQISIAEGNRLSVTQDEVTFSGHAIECRIYAEDPHNSFFPSIGTIEFLRSPSGFGVREEIGVEAKTEISPYYDPLISKLITWGRTRTEALDRMTAALGSYELFGVRNNLPLCTWIMGHPKFREGVYNTHFLQDHFRPERLSLPPESIVTAAALAAALSGSTLPSDRRAGTPAHAESKWRDQRRDNLR
jgi:acetyl-CoA carboxylase biotin carboxylase subunit